MDKIAALTSFGATSPLYNIQHDMYLPCLGSHLIIWLAGSNTLFVNSPTPKCSWNALLLATIGAYEESGKWIRGNGTKFVWNSFKSTFNSPSNLSDAVIELITWATMPNMNLNWVVLIKQDENY